MIVTPPVIPGPMKSSTACCIAPLFSTAFCVPFKDSLQVRAPFLPGKMNARGHVLRSQHSLCLSFLSTDQRRPATESGREKAERSYRDAAGPFWRGYESQGHHQGEEAVDHLDCSESHVLKQASARCAETHMVSQC